MPAPLRAQAGVPTRTRTVRTPRAPAISKICIHASDIAQVELSLGRRFQRVPLDIHPHYRQATGDGYVQGPSPPAPGRSTANAQEPRIASKHLLVASAQAEAEAEAVAAGLAQRSR